MILAHEILDGLHVLGNRGIMPVYYSQVAQKGRPARPQRVKARGVPLGYVEGLNDARTKLAGFFSNLLGFCRLTWV